MELDHEFTVPVPVDRAWSVLLDVERVAPCMPGATLDSVDDDEFTGRLKVKLGAMTITYRGTIRIVSQDPVARTVTMEGSGKEARGSGTASATMQAELHDDGEQTRVIVHTKLNVTGRPAQFGRGLLAEVGGKLVTRFADNLAEELAREPDDTTTGSTSAVADGTTDTGADTGTPDTGIGDTRPAEAERRPASSTVSPPETTGDAATEQTSAGGRPVAERPASVSKPQRSDDDAINLLEVAGPAVVKRAAPVLAGVVAILTIRHLFRRRRGRHHR